MANKNQDVSQLLTLRKRQKSAALMNLDKELKKAKDLIDKQSNESVRISATIGKIQSYRKELKEFNDFIFVHLDDATMLVEVDKAAAMDDTIFTHVCALQALVCQPCPQSPSSSISSVTQNSVGVKKSAVKLPELEIEPFDGDPLHFQEFWDSYCSTFHENQSLSPVEKFKYLKSFLTDEPLRLAQGYRLTSATYDAVIEALRERYGNTDIAVFAHLNALLALPPACDKLDSLQRVFDESEAHIRSLVALGLHEDTFGKVFAPILLTKLPPGVRTEVHRRNGNQPWILQNLRSLLRDELHARQMSRRTQQGEKRFGDSKWERGNGRGSDPPKKLSLSLSTDEAQSASGTASSLAVSGDGKRGTQPVPKYPCSLCGEKSSHFPFDCPNVVGLAARREKLKDRCSICLWKGHGPRDCKVGNRACKKCRKRGHHQLLCPSRYDSAAPATQTVQESSEPDSRKLEPSHSDAIREKLKSRGKAIMQTALATISGSKGSRVVRVLLDTASSHSFCRADVAAEIGSVPLTDEDLAVATFGAESRQQQSFPVHEVSLHLSNGSRLSMIVDVRKHIVLPIDKKFLDPTEFPVLNTFPLADPLTDLDERKQIDVLIGLDYYYQIICAEIISIGRGVVIQSSRFGYVLTGSLHDAEQESSDTVLFLNADLSSANYDLERFWRLEDAGLKNLEGESDDSLAQSQFDKTVQFDSTEGRYLVRWPWKEDSPVLHDNYMLSKGRLASLVKRTGAPLLEKYDQVIRDQIQKGVIEQAPTAPDGTVYYIPHHCVVKPDRATTKIRVVYDASSKARKDWKSLNECLYRGPVRLGDLCGLLMKFRFYPVALTSDIEKAFLMVGLQPCDRDVTRFLWLKNATAPLSDDNLVVFRFRRVPFGVISSPFLLDATIRHHLSHFDNDAARTIVENLYVDNVICGCQSLVKARDFYASSKQMLSAGGFNLREWSSNCKDFVDGLPEVDRGNSDSVKVLGLQWSVARDSLSCKFGAAGNMVVATKREALTALAKLFDPCGFFSPVTITGKMLLQELWLRKYEWDELLPADVLSRWRKLADDLRLIPSFEVPRRLVHATLDTCELHCFCDASSKAFAAVVYIRVPTAPPTCRLLFAKARVSPLKDQKQTIPRMELVAVTVGFRLVSFVVAQLPIHCSRCIVWTDSQCVVHWVLKRARSPVFVRNRVSEIYENNDVDLRYVSTTSNPADLPTRGCGFQELSESSLWWNGPPWLTSDESEWPIQPVVQPDGRETDVSVAAGTPDVGVGGHAIDIGRFSSLTKLVRSLAFVLRFVTAIRNRGRMSSLALQAAEVTVARKRLIQIEQRSRLAEVFHGEESNLKRQLGLFVHSDGFVRCSGRLDNSDVPFPAQYPILLGRDWPLTNLVILDCHNTLHHAGVSHVLAELRQLYWIPAGRSQVKKVISTCRPCRRLKGGPYRVPDPPPLPSFRSSEQVPFSHVGLDYMGPLMVVSSGTTQKVWLCLITCCSTRAVHLEVVGSLSTVDFLMCLRRFMSLYGPPKLIVSDNAKQFHLGNKVMNELWQDLLLSAEVQSELATKGISWKFITEMAPWMGGFYERMVGVVKCALRAAIQRRKLNLTELQTVVSEITATVNSRPLTYVSTDVGDEPLSPAHLLMRNRPMLGSRESGDNDTDYKPKVLTSDSAIAMWKRLQAVSDAFWKKWRRDYLVSLRDKRWAPKNRNTQCSLPSLGTVVQIADELPRGRWRIGRIAKLIVSQDDICRSVQVRLPDGSTLQRPIRLIHPLELAPETQNDAVKKSQRTERDAKLPKAKRAAALKARSEIQRQVAAEDSSEE